MISPETQILNTWHKNALPWTKAVRNQEIESRSLVTNTAIVQAILKHNPKTVLDIGCGEGWLIRELATHGIDGLGVDAIPGLIEQATQAGKGHFVVASYEAIAQGQFVEHLQKRGWEPRTAGLPPSFLVAFDVVVCNFSLFGDRSVADLVRSIPNFLTETGLLIIQTLHPRTACGDLPYQDGWREGSWAGFSSEFSEPAPWYFRTLENWLNLLQMSGFARIETQEPQHPKTQQLMSIIFSASCL